MAKDPERIRRRPHGLGTAWPGLEPPGHVSLQRRMSGAGDSKVLENMMMSLSISGGSLISSR